MTFSKLNIVELASVLAGPSVGMFFAELGATVIKVENLKTKGDVTRQWKLKNENKSSDISAYYSSANWGKRSIGLDLTKKEGQAIVYDLVRSADVVITSYKPGDPEKLKVDYKTLKKVNPAIIYAHITGYGEDNPRTGYDAIVQGEAGIMSMNGYPDKPPAKLPLAITDILTAHQIKEGILLALINKAKTGKGNYVSASLIHSGIATLSNQATNWLMGKEIPERLGSDHPNIAPYGTVFTTKDKKEIVLAVGSNKQFLHLTGVLKINEKDIEKYFSTNQLRVKNKEKLKKILQQKINLWKGEILLSKLEKLNIPAGRVRNMQEVFKQKEAKEMVLTSGKIKSVRTISFNKKHENILPPPRFAEHTDTILVKLGYSKEKIATLRKQRVIS